MIYSCRQCGEVLGIDHYGSEFCNEICAGEYARFLETGTRSRPNRRPSEELHKVMLELDEVLNSSPAEKIDNRFEILDL